MDKFFEGKDEQLRNRFSDVSSTSRIYTKIELLWGRLDFEGNFFYSVLRKPFILMFRKPFFLFHFTVGRTALALPSPRHPMINWLTDLGEKMRKDANEAHRSFMRSKKGAICYLTSISQISMQTTT